MSFRKLRLEDIVDIPEKKENDLYNNLNIVPKHQEVFGHKKRIKP